MCPASCAGGGRARDSTPPLTPAATRLLCVRLIAGPRDRERNGRREKMRKGRRNKPERRGGVAAAAAGVAENEPGVGTAKKEKGNKGKLKLERESVGWRGQGAEGGRLPAKRVLKVRRLHLDHSFTAVSPGTLS